MKTVRRSSCFVAYRGVGVVGPWFDFSGKMNNEFPVDDEIIV